MWDRRAKHRSARNALMAMRQRQRQRKSRSASPSPQAEREIDLALLRAALEPDLRQFMTSAQRATPGIDAVTVGSLLILYGLEIGLQEGPQAKEQMRTFLRIITQIVDGPSSPLGALNTLGIVGGAEPGF
jgi:hypothetical protein